VRLPILRLSGTLPPGQPQALASAVLARAALAAAAGAAAVPAVVLVLEETAEIGPDGRQALRDLHAALGALGAGLRVVIEARQPREALRRALASAHPGGLAVHPSTRSAILAAYAELPGPGLVTPEIRAALAEPAEPLDRGARFTPRGWSPRSRPAGELTTP
jgi:hypothetical protein